MTVAGLAVGKCRYDKSCTFQNLGETVDEDEIVLDQHDTSVHNSSCKNGGLQFRSTILPEARLI